MRTIIVCIWAITACSLCQSCTGGVKVYTESPQGTTALGSPFPADLSLPDAAGLEHRIFVLTAAPPLGLFRFRITDTHPYPFDFFDLSRALTGTPDELLIVDDRTAFITITAADALVEIDPSSGEIRGVLDLEGETVSLEFAMEDSQGEPVESFPVSFPSGAALLDDKLYISTSNIRRAGADPIFYPGTVLVFARDGSTSPPTYAPADTPVLVTTAFNPTGVTPYQDGILLVTNTGVLDIEEGSGAPRSEATIDVVDTGAERIVGTIPLGYGAPSFKPIAIDHEYEVGFIGSAAFNHVYEIDLEGLEELLGTEPEAPPLLPDRVIAGADNPIVVTPAPSGSPEFVHQVATASYGGAAFATCFNGGWLARLDTSVRPAAVRSLTRLTEPMPSLSEVGPGPLAARPGRPGEDFTGDDLFVLTGYPTGLLLSLKTYK